jgi:hypothetical protein
MKGGGKMTIQGTGMSAALRLYNTYTTRGNNTNQSETAELRENQEAKQQIAIEGMEPPDGKGVPRGKPPAGEGGPKGAGGPPPKPITETDEDEETSETTSLSEEESLIETLLNLTATLSSDEEDEESSDDILGLSTLEDLLKLTGNSSEGAISEEMQTILLKRFEEAYQSIQPPEMNGQPPELNIDTDNDELWNETEISEFIEAENLDVNASEIVSNYDTDGDSMINSEEREAMRVDNAFNLPMGGPGGPGGMPPPQMAADLEEDEEMTQEEISNLFAKKVEAAYLNASRGFSETDSYLNAVL